MFEFLRKRKIKKYYSMLSNEQKEKFDKLVKWGYSPEYIREQGIDRDYFPPWRDRIVMTLADGISEHKPGSLKGYDDS